MAEGVAEVLGRRHLKLGALGKGGPARAHRHRSGRIVGRRKVERVLVARHFDVSIYLHHKQITIFTTSFIIADDDVDFLALRVGEFEGADIGAVDGRGAEVESVVQEVELVHHAVGAAGVAVDIFGQHRSLLRLILADDRQHGAAAVARCGLHKCELADADNGTNLYIVVIAACNLDGIVAHLRTAISRRHAVGRAFAWLPGLPVVKAQADLFDTDGALIVDRDRQTGGNAGRPFRKIGGVDGALHHRGVLERTVGLRAGHRRQRSQRPEAQRGKFCIHVLFG